MPYYEAFAQRGIAVFAEKPFALTQADHQRILDMFPAYGIACGYLRRTFAATMLLRQAVLQRWFGPLQRIRCSEGGWGSSTGMDHPHYDNIDAAGGGILMALGCHELDRAFYLTGATSYQMLRDHLEMDDRIDREVEATIQLHGLDNGQEEPCQLEMSTSYLHEQDNALTLEFPRAVLTTGFQPNSEVVLRTPGAPASRRYRIELDEGARNANQAVFLEWDHFLKGLERREPSLMAASGSLLAAGVIDEIYSKVRRP
jgi:predicted dehydrogenase